MEERSSKACTGGPVSTLLTGVLDHMIRSREQMDTKLSVTPFISQEPLAMWAGEGRASGATGQQAVLSQQQTVCCEQLILSGNSGFGSPQALIMLL